MGQYRPAARARTPWSSSARASSPNGGGDGEAAETISRSGGASGRSGLTGLGPDETGECSPNSGLPGSDPSEKARRVRERRGDAGGGDEDEEEEDAIVAEGRTATSRGVAGGGGGLGREAPTEETLSGRKGEEKARESSERACLESLGTCRNKREPFVWNVAKAY